MKVQGLEIDVEHLRKRKSYLIAYTLWLFGGWFGAHLLYADRLVHGVLAATSLNFLTLGWYMDFLLIPTYIQKANKSTSALAVSDLQHRGCCSFLCKGWCVGILAVCWMVFALTKMPGYADSFGIVDLELERSGLNQNPYDILGIPRGTTFYDMTADYQFVLKARKDKEKAKAFAYFEQKEKNRASPSSNTRRRRSLSKTKGGKERPETESEVLLDGWADEAKAQWEALGNQLQKQITKQFAGFSERWKSEKGDDDADDESSPSPSRDESEL